MEYHEEFSKVIKAIIRFFCDPHNTDEEEMKLLLKAFVLIIKTKEKWALQLLQNKLQYDLIEKSLELLKLCRHRQITK